MPILREITAKLDLKLDKRSFAQADKRVNSLSNSLKRLGTFAGGALLLGGTAGLLKFIEMGSDANETLNLLNESFKENASDVTDWAATFAGAANRSEFELREMAGTLGAVLNPLMDQNTEIAAEMSTNLAQLAVDLGSFFNVSDTNAIDALRSGIVGETEAIKRLGVVMLDTTLEAFRLEQGITKQFKAMNIAEKTALRYEFILDQTKLAQGDAVRTAEGWANATKGLSSAFKDLGTRIGLTVIPFAEKLVNNSRDAVRRFNEWAQESQIIKASLISLGAAGVAIAIAMIVAWGPVVLPFVLAAAGIVLAAIALDDFLVFMRGGKSVIGQFIDSISGPGSAESAVKFLKDAWEGMVLFWNTDVIQSMRLISSFFSDTAEDLGKKWDEFFEGWKEGFNVVAKAASKAAAFLGIDVALGQISGEVSEIRKRSRISADDVLTRFVPFSDIADPSSVNGGGSTTVSNSVTVQVQGNATANDAARIADASGEAMRRAARKTQAALVQRSE